MGEGCVYEGHRIHHIEMEMEIKEGTLIREQQGRKEGREEERERGKGKDWEQILSVQHLNNCNTLLLCFTCKYYNHDFTFQYHGRNSI